MAKKIKKKETNPDIQNQDNNQQAQQQPPAIQSTESEQKEEKIQVDVPEKGIETPSIELPVSSSAEKSVENNKEKGEDKAVIDQIIQPVQSAQPVQLDQSAQPVQLDQSAQPVQLDQSAQPVQPAQSAQSAQPVQSAQSAQPVQSAQSAQPVQLDQSAQPVQPAQSAQPVQPAQEGTIEEKLEAEKEQVSEKEMQERQVRDFHRNQIEASLYAAGKLITIEELSTKLELPKKEVNELIKELALDYLDRSTSLIIVQIGDRYQMQIKPEYTEKVSKFATGGAIAEKYLRTLTLIALKQPILKSTIIKLRGSGAYEHIKYLIDNDLILAVKKGRSEDLTTTDKYAEMFGLPKDREEMKRMMINQLGLEEIDNKAEGTQESKSEETQEPKA